MRSSEDEIAIVNASPLICLAKAGLLTILFRVFPKVCIPRSVFDEVMAGPEDDLARMYLDEAGEITIVDPASPSEIVREWDLGAGETSVLSCTLETMNSIAIIDDAAARKCARTLNIPYCGSLGVLAKAHKAGIITDLNVCIVAIQESGLFLSQSVIEQLNKM